jgi:hypothetical protein
MIVQEAYQRMLELLDQGLGVLTGGEIHPDIPTIQDISHRDGVRLQCLKEVRHIVLGLFKGETASGEFSFDGGGAMRRVTDDEDNYLFAFTPLHAERVVLEELGYDAEAVRQAIEELIDAAV